ncbi:MAG: LamG domain-containing protein [Leadbetterella sp.]|nr:LamG domain-containing protein [Leadbetterella sp.]
MMAAALSMAGCQDLERPVLGEYQTDEPIVGDLKFFAPFDGDYVEDMKKSVGKGAGASFVTGVNGQAVELDGKAGSIVSMRTTNDFKNATSFTVSYWLKMNAPSKSGAQFVWSNPTTSGEWPGANTFQLIEDGGQSNNGLMATKFVVHGAWLEFVFNAETGIDNRIPGVMNNQWHHWVLTYNESTSLMTVFLDGKKQALTKLVEKDDTSSTENPKPRIPYGKADLSKSTKFVIGGPPHPALGTTPDDWMTTYQGGLDQFRMYSKVLTDAEITALFSGKE